MILQWPSLITFQYPKFNYLIKASSKDTELNFLKVKESLITIILPELKGNFQESIQRVKKTKNMKMKITVSRVNI